MNKIGIDIVEVNRIQLTESMIKSILHNDEMKYLEKLESDDAKKQFLAGRWAVKEAIIKVVDNPLLPKNMNIGYNGKKPIVLNEDLKHIEISIAHEKNYAVATALNL
ncbi:holo-[acyl-carrier-protein] synthase [Spiroplasma chinense]|uniref:Holo-[acyl-carrier-protein] synthase n=1 Tax=Spiroplasma chinense TaxID=216932 RepID=A0A5B9Y7K7_9MOLU|nr:4'-phosphopantetheinyl transferase superfamily protein [Spiroplasma chinense]QEH62082.1 holo-[acyl-carrier-protein] synthase [Spiroplasma chinense]